MRRLRLLLGVPVGPTRRGRRGLGALHAHCTFGWCRLGRWLALHRVPPALRLRTRVNPCTPRTARVGRKRGWFTALPFSTLAAKAATCPADKRVVLKGLVVAYGMHFATVHRVGGAGRDCVVAGRVGARTAESTPNPFQVTVLRAKPAPPKSARNASQSSDVIAPTALAPKRPGVSGSGPARTDATNLHNRRRCVALASLLQLSRAAGRSTASHSAQTATSPAFFALAKALVPPRVCSALLSSSRRASSSAAASPMERTMSESVVPR